MTLYDIYLEYRSGNKTAFNRIFSDNLNYLCTIYQQSVFRINIAGLDGLIINLYTAYCKAGKRIKDTKYPKYHDSAYNGSLEDMRKDIIMLLLQIFNDGDFIAHSEGELYGELKYRAVKFVNGNGNTDPNKSAFDELYAKWNHDVEMNRVTQEEYINWLDGAYKQYFSDLTKYQDEYNKYEAEVYNARKDREQDLFDKKIENYKKLSDNALEKYVDGDGNELTVNASFDYARSQINGAIAETQSRINELSLKTGFEDEIENLKSDLEGLYDTLDDINKKEIDSQKDYIDRLKDEYSDLMDERISEQKKLADNINEAYENQIETIDRQIEAIKKVSEAEERQKKILEAEKDVKEAMQELDKAKLMKRLVYGGNGSWNLKEDKSAVDEAKKNLADKQESLDKAKEDDKIAALEEQKELLENQKNDSKAYYDKVVEDLEAQKSDREKQYDILVDIYEQLGGEKRQTDLNDGLVAKLTAGGDINKAVEGLTPTELQQAFASGILTTDSNGNYAIDYNILGKNQQAVAENTAEIEKAKSELERLNNQFSGKNQSNTPDKTNKNLDAEGYLIDDNGKRILNDGKPIHAKRNPNIVPLSEVDVSQIKDKQTLELFNILKAPVATPIPMNINNTTPLRTDTGEIMNISANNAPTVNFTVNVDGSADEKTVQAMKDEIGKALLNYTNKMISSLNNSTMRRISKI